MRLGAVLLLVVGVLFVNWHLPQLSHELPASRPIETQLLAHALQLSAPAPPPQTLEYFSSTLGCQALFEHVMVAKQARTGEAAMPARSTVARSNSNGVGYCEYVLDNGVRLEYHADGSVKLFP